MTDIGVSSLQKADTIASVTQRADQAFTRPSILEKIVFIPKKHEIKYRKKFPGIFLKRVFFSDLFKRDSPGSTRHSAERLIIAIKLNFLKKFLGCAYILHSKLLLLVR